MPRKPYVYLPEIAFATEYPDDEDSPLWYFQGASPALLVRVFNWLVKGGALAEGYEWAHHQRPVWRDGHAYFYSTVRLRGWNKSFINAHSLNLLVYSRLRAELQRILDHRKGRGRIKVEQFTLYKFMNL